MEDRKLLAGLKKGQAQYYEKLIDDYTPYLSRVVYKVGNGRLTTEDMEELCADVLIKIWESRGKLNVQEGYLKSYMGAMARNMTLNKIRSVTKHEVLPVEEDQIEYETPESQLLKEEEKQVLKEVIASLPEPDNEIFIRRYFYLEKLSEIAKEVGIEVATVGTKLHRGKEKLAKALRERGIRYE